MTLKEEIRRKKMLAGESRKWVEESGCLLVTAASVVLPNAPASSVPSAPSAQTEKILRPKDVISWLSNFDGSGNVRIFLREV